MPDEQVERKVFTVKLHELEQQCCTMQEYLHRCQREELSVLHDEIKQLIQECQEAESLLQQRVTKSHSTVASQIAQAQQAYNQNIKEILQWDLFAQEYLVNTSVSEEYAEVITLYAEYAVDFTLQAMRRSLLAMLYAIELQIILE